MFSRVLLACLLLSLFTLAHCEVAVSGGVKIPAASSTSFVKTLTDATFEHDTHSSTGATTGDWFVEFYAPWCGHCVKLAPDWDRLSVWAREEQIPISIAKLDGTEEVRTAKRFDIRGFPSLKLFSQGKVYDYSGARTLDAMKKYIEGREWAGSDGKAVPVQLSWSETMRDSLREQMNGLKEMLYRKTGGVVVLVTIGFLVGILASMLVFIVFIEKKPIIHAVQLASRAGVSGGTQTNPLHIDNVSGGVLPPKPKNPQAKKAE